MDDIQKSNNTCPACKSLYRTTYYQRRAADEPPDIVQFCPNCPLDTAKLSTNYKPINSVNRDGNNSRNNINSTSSHRRTSSSIDTYRTRYSSSNITGPLYKIGYRFCIRVRGIAAQEYYNQQIENNVILQPLIINALGLNTSGNKQIIKIRTSTILNEEGHLLLASNTIAPFVSLEHLAIYKVNSLSDTTSRQLVDSYEIQIDNIKHSECVVLSSLQKGKSPCISIFLHIEKDINRYDENKCLSILHEILTRYGTETTIKTFISSQLINILYSQSAKAYDWPSAPDKGYKYTWKPDGERFWYIKYGSVWLFCRRFLSGRLTGWKLASNLSTFNKPGPVLDIEVMIGFQPILIDILVTDSGEPTLLTRSLDTVLNIYYNSKNIDIPIYIREYFNTESELLKTKSMLQYPIDGAIGIQDGSMNIIKLKDKKSIELQLQDNGNLVSAEGKLVAKSQLQNIYSTNSIIEIRFTQDSSKDIPVITETLLRTDKTKANDYIVCQSILNTMSVMPDDLSRRNAVQWCNTIRQKIHDIASKIKDAGRVILDIGAGDGQAISDYSNDSTVTYVLLEPNKNKCEKLLRRLSEPGKGKSKLFEGAENITRAINLTSNKTLKYAIVHASIGEVLKQQYIIRTLKSSVRCCIASYSISYMASELTDLALSGISIIGCGYMYDNIDNNGILVHKAGVTMKLTNPNVADCSDAIVIWGKDKAYPEPAIRIKDFNETMYVEAATSFVPIAIDDTSSLLYDISSNIYIISTDKNI